MISLVNDAVSITEGERRNISINLSMTAEREVPVMFRIMLRSAFSSMYIILPLLLSATYMAAFYLIDESDIRAVTTPMSFFAPGMMYLSILLEAVDDQIAEDTEAFDVIVEAVNPFDSVSSQNTSTVYISDNDGNKLIKTLNICVPLHASH